MEVFYCFLMALLLSRFTALQSKSKNSLLHPPPSVLWPLSPSVILPFPALPSAHLEVKVWWFFNNRDHLKPDHKSSSIHRLAGMLMRDGWVSWMLWCRARFTLMCLWSFFPGKMFVTILIDAQLWFLPEKLTSTEPFDNSELTLKSNITAWHHTTFLYKSLALIQFDLSFWLFWHENVTLTKIPRRRADSERTTEKKPWCCYWGKATMSDTCWYRDPSDLLKPPRITLSWLYHTANLS